MNKTQPPEFVKENKELNFLESNRPFQEKDDKKGDKKEKKADKKGEDKKEKEKDSNVISFEADK